MDNSKPQFSYLQNIGSDKIYITEMCDFQNLKMRPEYNFRHTKNSININSLV